MTEVVGRGGDGAANTVADEGVGQACKYAHIPVNTIVYVFTSAE